MDNYRQPNPRKCQTAHPGDFLCCQAYDKKVQWTFFSLITLILFLMLHADHVDDPREIFRTLLVFSFGNTFRQETELS